MTTHSDAAREAARRSSGRFGVQQRAEADVALEPGPTLRDPATMSREELLADADLKFAPREWLAAKSDAELASMLAEIRIARLRAQEQERLDKEARLDEEPGRAPWTQPGWLRPENVRGQRRFSTPEGYSVQDVVAYADGQAVQQYSVSAPPGGQTVVVDRIEDAVAWIDSDRAVRAINWTESFPPTSPAARVVALRGAPVETWISRHGEDYFVLADGSYVATTGGEDDWAVAEGEFADGTYFDAGGSYGDRRSAQICGERVLRAGREAYEKSQEW